MGGFCGARDPAHQTTCKKWAPRASPAQRVAWGEDEQGSGVRNARQGVLNGADFARTTKPVSFSLLEKERFLESKEKGAPVRVEWLQIGIRRPGFTPPLSTSTVHRRLRRWNRESRGSIRHFFAACVGGCRGVVALSGIAVAASREGCAGRRRPSPRGITKNTGAAGRQRPCFLVWCSMLYLLLISRDRA